MYNNRGTTVLGISENNRVVCFYRNGTSLGNEIRQISVTNSAVKPHILLSLTASFSIAKGYHGK